MRRAIVGSILLVVLGALAPGASGAGSTEFGGSSFVGFGGSGSRLVELKKIPVTVQGDLVVDFHGDPGSGCEPVGLCGVSGSVTVAPGRKAGIAVFEYVRRGRRAAAGFLSLEDGPTRGPRVSAQIRRTAAGGATPTCVDARPASSFLSLDASPTAGVRLSLTTSRSDAFVADLLRTRCAGPTSADVARAAPVVQLSPAQLRQGRARVDLSGTQGFAAGGLAGSVRSSLVLHLGRVVRLRGRQLVEPGANLPAGRAERLTNAEYRIESIAGSVTTTVSALASGPCASLDACGASGSVVTSPTTTSGSFTLGTSAPTRRARRDSRVALGLLPGRRPRGFDVGGGGDWSAGHGMVVADLARPGEPTPCRSTVPLTGGFLGAHVRGSRLVVTYAPREVADVSLNPLATRCPGPTLTDVLPRAGALATGSVPLSALRRRRVTLRLNRGASGGGARFKGVVRPEITVVLSRRRVRETIVR